jgi:hypothetical protein
MSDRDSSSELSQVPVSQPVAGSERAKAWPSVRQRSPPSLEKGFEFDLFAFAEIMDRIIPALQGVPGWIREEMDGRWEAAYVRLHLPVRGDAEVFQAVR